MKSEREELEKEIGETPWGSDEMENSNQAAANEKAIIQITSNTVDGAFCAVSSNVLLSDCILDVIHGDYYEVNSIVERVVHALSNLVNGEYTPMIFGRPYTDIDTIYITDCLLRADTLSAMLEYNKAVNLHKKSGNDKFPKILYCYNNSSNFNDSTSNIRYPGVPKTTMEHWTTYLINRYHLVVEPKVLSALNAAIEQEQKMMRIKNPKESKNKTVINAGILGKNMKTFISFYGFDRFVTMMANKVKVLNQIEFTKSELYSCKALERHTVRKLVDMIHKSTIISHIDSDNITSTVVSIIYVDKDMYPYISAALYEYNNLDYAKCGLAESMQVDVVIAIDIINKDVCIRYADSSNVTSAYIKTAKMKIRNMLFKVPTPVDDESGKITECKDVFNIMTSIELPVAEMVDSHCNSYRVGRK